MKYLLSILFLVSVAEATPSSFSVRMVGRSEATITTSTILLGDISDFTGVNPLDEAIIALKKIEIQKAPMPGKSVVINADQILSKMKDAGVDLQKVGYSLPRVITVKQASRALSIDEARSAIEQYFSAKSDKTVVRNISFTESADVFPGNINLKVQDLSPAIRGKIATVLLVSNNEGIEQRVPVSIVVDEFREIPVASRSLQKGVLIEPGDVVMARMNISELAEEATEEPGTLIGLEANRGIRAGEPFFNSNVKIPPLVTAGSTVTMQYKSGALIATATGTALDTGILGTEIRIRNEQSKKILKGKILEPGLVGVIQ